MTSNDEIMMPAAVPDDVLAAMARALGVAWITLTPLSGGTNRRTYRASDPARAWVARIEPAPALSLVRAVAAQEQASAGGVRVPVTVAHDVTASVHGSYVWSIETLAGGQPWLPGMDVAHELRAAADLGHQLRRLHATSVDAFGDRPPRPYPVYPSFAAWVANKAHRIAPAVALAGGDPEQSERIARVYTSLATWYDGPPRLCKGDCAGNNLPGVASVTPVLCRFPLQYRHTATRAIRSTGRGGPCPSFPRSAVGCGAGAERSISHRPS
jgi:aminoglycoside phosphotransferase (APT) family kinase protein